MALFFMMGERDIETALRQPWTSIGSDAGAAAKFGEVDALGLPHPRAYGNVHAGHRASTCASATCSRWRRRSAR